MLSGTPHTLTRDPETPRPRSMHDPRHAGASLVEVLVTLVILAIGLLGVAGLQSKMALAEMESFQRAQAVLLLSEIMDRMNANRVQADSYVTAGTIGTGDGQPVDCSGIAQGPNRDLCEWSNALKGAAEQQSTAKIGGMIGARACITREQAPDPSLGVCAPGIYRVSVAWQGMTPTTTPALACGTGLYGAEANRRLISARLVIAPLATIPPATTPSISCY